MSKATDSAARYGGIDPKDLIPRERALTPAVTRLNETRVARGFWPTLRRTAGRVPFARDAVALFYCARDPQTPTSAKAMIMAALAYFVLPIDAIPDVLAGVGYTDDAAVIAAVIALVSRNIKQRHKEEAARFLDRLARDA